MDSQVGKVQNTFGIIYATLYGFGFIMTVVWALYQEKKEKQKGQVTTPSLGNGRNVEDSLEDELDSNHQKFDLDNPSDTEINLSNVSWSSVPIGNQLLIKADEKRLSKKKKYNFTCIFPLSSQDQDKNNTFYATGFNKFDYNNVGTRNFVRTRKSIEFDDGTKYSTQKKIRDCIETNRRIKFRIVNKNENNEDIDVKADDNKDIDNTYNDDSVSIYLNSSKLSQMEAVSEEIPNDMVEYVFKECQSYKFGKGKSKSQMEQEYEYFDLRYGNIVCDKGYKDIWCVTCDIHSKGTHGKGDLLRFNQKEYKWEKIELYESELKVNELEMREEKKKDKNSMVFAAVFDFENRLHVLYSDNYKENILKHKIYDGETQKWIEKAPLMDVNVDAHWPCGFYCISKSLSPPRENNSYDNYNNEDDVCIDGTHGINSSSNRDQLYFFMTFASGDNFRKPDSFGWYYDCKSDKWSKKHNLPFTIDHATTKCVMVNNVLVVFRFDRDISHQYLELFIFDHLIRKWKNYSGLVKDFNITPHAYFWQLQLSDVSFIQCSDENKENALLWVDSFGKFGHYLWKFDFNIIAGELKMKNQQNDTNNTMLDSLQLEQQITTRGRRQRQEQTIFLRVWKYRSIYLSWIIHFSDVITDYLIIAQYYIYSLNYNHYNNNVDYRLVTLASILTIVLNKIMSGYYIWKFTNSKINTLLNIFDFYIFKEVYASHYSGNQTDLFKFLQKIERVFESTPQFVIQTYVLLRDNNNINDNNIFNLMIQYGSIFFSLFSIAAKLVSDDSKFFIRKSGANKVWIPAKPFLFRVWFRLCEIVANLFVYVIIGVFYGAYVGGIYVFCKLVINSILFRNGLLGAEKANIIAYLVGVMNLGLIPNARQPEQMCIFSKMFKIIIHLYVGIWERVLPHYYQRYFAFYLILSRIVESLVIVVLTFILYHATNDSEWVGNGTFFPNTDSRYASGLTLEIFLCIIVLCLISELIFYVLSCKNMSLGVSLTRKTEIYINNYQFYDAFRMEEINNKNKNHDELSIMKTLLNILVEQNVPLLMITEDENDYICQQNKDNTSTKQRQEHIYFLNKFNDVISDMDGKTALEHMKPILEKAIVNCHLTVILLLLRHNKQWFDNKLCEIKYGNSKLKNELNLLLFINQNCSARRDIIDCVCIHYYNYLTNFEKMLIETMGNNSKELVLHSFFVNGKSYNNVIAFICKKYWHVIMDHSVLKYIFSKHVAQLASIVQTIVNACPLNDTLPGWSIFKLTEINDHESFEAITHIYTYLKNDNVFGLTYLNISLREKWRWIGNIFENMFIQNEFELFCQLVDINVKHFVQYQRILLLFMEILIKNINDQNHNKDKIDVILTESNRLQWFTQIVNTFGDKINICDTIYCQYNKKSLKTSMLHVAILHGFTDIVKLFLEKQDHNVDLIVNSKTNKWNLINVIAMSTGNVQQRAEMYNLFKNKFKQEFELKANNNNESENSDSNTISKFEISKFVFSEGISKYGKNPNMAGWGENFDTMPNGSTRAVAIAKIDNDDIDAGNDNIGIKKKEKDVFENIIYNAFVQHDLTLVDFLLNHWNINNIDDNINNLINVVSFNGGYNMLKLIVNQYGNGYNTTNLVISCLIFEKYFFHHIKQQLENGNDNEYQHTMETLDFPQILKICVESNYQLFCCMLVDMKLPSKSNYYSKWDKQSLAEDRDIIESIDSDINTMYQHIQKFGINNISIALLSHLLSPSNARNDESMDFNTDINPVQSFLQVCTNYQDILINFEINNLCKNSVNFTDFRHYILSNLIDCDNVPLVSKWLKLLDQQYRQQDHSNRNKNGDVDDYDDYDEYDEEIYYEDESDEKAYIFNHIIRPRAHFMIREETIGGRDLAFCYKPLRHRRELLNQFIYAKIHSVEMTQVLAEFGLPVSSDNDKKLMFFLMLVPVIKYMLSLNDDKEKKYKISLTDLQAAVRDRREYDLNIHPKEFYFLCHILPYCDKTVQMEFAVHFQKEYKRISFGWEFNWQPKLLFRTLPLILDKVNDDEIAGIGYDSYSYSFGNNKTMTINDILQFAKDNNPYTDESKYIEVQHHVCWILFYIYIKTNNQKHFDDLLNTVDLRALKQYQFKDNRAVDTKYRLFFECCSMKMQSTPTYENKEEKKDHVNKDDHEKEQEKQQMQLNMLKKLTNGIYHDFSGTKHIWIEKIIRNGDVGILNTALNMFELNVIDFKKFNSNWIQLAQSLNKTDMIQQLKAFEQQQENQARDQESIKNYNETWQEYLEIKQKFQSGSFNVSANRLADSLLNMYPRYLQLTDNYNTDDNIHRYYQNIVKNIYCNELYFCNANYFHEIGYRRDKNNGYAENKNKSGMFLFHSILKNSDVELFSLLQLIINESAKFGWKIPIVAKQKMKETQEDKKNEMPNVSTTLALKNCDVNDKQSHDGVSIQIDGSLDVNVKTYEQDLVDGDDFNHAIIDAMANQLSRAGSQDYNDTIASGDILKNDLKKEHGNILLLSDNNNQIAIECLVFGNYNTKYQFAKFGNKNKIKTSQEKENDQKLIQLLHLIQTKTIHAKLNNIV